MGQENAIHLHAHVFSVHPIPSCLATADQTLPCLPCSPLFLFLRPIKVCFLQTSLSMQPLLS